MSLLVLLPIIRGATLSIHLDTVHINTLLKINTSNCWTFTLAMGKLKVIALNTSF